MTTTLDVDSVIERLLSVRGQPNNRTVQLAEGEIRALCAAARYVLGRFDANARRARSRRASGDRRRVTRARRGFGAGDGRVIWSGTRACVCVGVCAGKCACVRGEG